MCVQRQGQVQAPGAHAQPHQGEGGGLPDLRQRVCLQHEVQGPPHTTGGGVVSQPRPLLLLLPQVPPQRAPLAGTRPQAHKRLQVPALRPDL